MMVDDAKIPWYSLHPRLLHLGKWTWWLIACAAVLYFFYTCSFKPLWQIGWRTHLYCREQFDPVESATGKKFRGGDWVTSRKILVYGAPGVKAREVRKAADGMRSIVDELHLNLSVQMVSTPPDAARSIAAATTNKGKIAARFDQNKFIARRLDERGMMFAEMVVVDAHFADPEWAFGLADFPSGVAVLQKSVTTPELGRHEGTHLLGYDRHDDFPYYVFGYPEGWYPAGRATLMMLRPMGSPQLSPRARDAVINFWRGLETKKRRYFK